MEISYFNAPTFESVTYICEVFKGANIKVDANRYATGSEWTLCFYHMDYICTSRKRRYNTAFSGYEIYKFRDRKTMTEFVKKYARRKFNA